MNSYNSYFLNVCLALNIWQVSLISFNVYVMPHLTFQRVQILPFVLELSLPGALNTVICDDDDDDDDDDRDGGDDDGA